MNVYRYFFNGGDKPVEIEAINKANSLILLEQIIARSKNKIYALDNIKNETVERLIPNISTKKVKGKTLLYTPQGWIEHTTNDQDKPDIS